jgi:cystathionine beta-lyase/cystathionine gamma-synthase
MPNTNIPGFSTRAIHVGNEADPSTGAVAPPIFATSTYAQEELGKTKGYDYSRAGNPTRTRLEENLASLEGGIAARVFSSGMASISAICQMMKAGDHIVASNTLYGGVPRLFNQILSNYGLGFTYVDTTEPHNVERAIRKNTRYVHIETPTNPMMGLTDIAVVSRIAHKHGCEVVVDNTFLSPYFQQPIKFGADIVMHSTTKFLNGHSDGIGGALVCTTKEQSEKLAFIQKAVGAILSPFECWLVLRGVKTLAVRMRQHDENGRAIAEFLSRHRKVKKVLYPGLKSHPQYELARRQQTGFGSMITIETGSLGNAKRLLKRVRVCTLGESLGGVETLISHPASMTHAAIGEAGRKAIGLTDGMVRLSVGIEDVEDLIRDLEQALAGM